MSGTNSRLNPLQLQKQLLLAESELNRSQLVQDAQAMADEVHSLVNQAKSLRSLASAAAILINGAASLRRKQSAPAAEPASWWRTACRGAGLLFTFLQQRG